jgi:hypothetical protein
LLCVFVCVCFFFLCVFQMCVCRFVLRLSIIEKRREHTLRSCVMRNILPASNSLII